MLTYSANWREYLVPADNRLVNQWSQAWENYGSMFKGVFHPCYTFTFIGRPVLSCHGLRCCKGHKTPIILLSQQILAIRVKYLGYNFYSSLKAEIVWVHYIVLSSVTYSFHKNLSHIRDNRVKSVIKSCNLRKKSDQPMPIIY